jgi:hypothetical protein
MEGGREWEGEGGREGEEEGEGGREGGGGGRGREVKEGRGGSWVEAI